MWILRKVALVVGSVSMFKILQEIIIATALNSKAQIPISLPPLSTCAKNYC